MKRVHTLPIHLVFAALIGVTPLLGGCTPWGRVGIGDAGPELAAISLDDRPVTLSDVKGTATLLLFSAGNCCGDLPVIVDGLQKQYGASGLRVLIISVDSKKMIRQQIRDGSLTCPVVADPRLISVRRYGVRVYPVTFLLDASGTVAAKVVGIVPAEHLVEHVQAVLAKAPPAPTSAGEHRTGN